MKSLADFAPSVVASSCIVRVRDGEPPLTWRGSDLDSWRRAIADKREGDRYYLIPEHRPLFAPLPPLFAPLPSVARQTVHAYQPMRFPTNAFETPEELELRLAAAVRALRASSDIETDTYKSGAEVAPLDDPSDRFAQMELDDDDQT